MIIDKRMAEIFDTETIENAEELTIIDNDSGEIVESKEQKIENDFENSRVNLQNLIKTGYQAVTDAITIARNSEHPRAYEVVGNLLTQVSDMNQQLLTLHQMKRKLDEPKSSDIGQITNNNSLFITTSDLAKMVQDMNKGKE